MQNLRSRLLISKRCEEVAYGLRAFRTQVVTVDGRSAARHNNFARLAILSINH
jgi:translation elongation factor EF-1beta